MAPNAKEVLKHIELYYQCEPINDYISLVSDTLRIVQAGGLEVGSTQLAVQNLIFSVFATFFPEFFEQLRLEEEAKAKQEGEGKFKIRMLPINENAILKGQGEKFALFRNSELVTPRLELLSTFCERHKRIINKLIKNRPQLINEINDLFRQMPNLPSLITLPSG